MCQERGVIIQTDAKVLEVDHTEKEICINCVHAAEELIIKTSLVINAAGLHAHLYAKSTEYQLRYCKGDYFSSNMIFNSLVYPAPEADGLGVHLTIDISGSVTFGPDTEYVDNIDFDVKEEKEILFRQHISKYLKCASKIKLAPSYSGIRPKLYMGEKKIGDFLIETYFDHSNSHVHIDLLGFESPGLTASMPVGKYVSELLNLHG